MKQPRDMHVVSIIDIMCEDKLIGPFKVKLGVEALGAVIMNFGRYQ